MPAPAPLSPSLRKPKVTGSNPVRRVPLDGSAELIGQSDDDALWASQEAEPVDVLVLRDLADEFSAVAAAQAVDDIDDVVGRLRDHGAELVGEMAQYEDIYRLCFLRGPEGIVIGLSEKLG